MIAGNGFEKYINTKGIKVCDNIITSVNDKNVDNKNLEIQLQLISEFHKKVAGYNGTFKDRLDSDIGKMVEQCKVSIKKLKRDLEKIKKEGTSNCVDEILKKHGMEYIEKGEKSIKSIYENNYYKLITRSMENKEICLQNVDFKELTKDNYINIKTIDKCKYNMVEIDAINLLYRYKKKGINLKLNNLINKFCELEDLNENSFKFISSLISFPHEFMKQCNRYRYRKGELSYEEYKDKIQKAILQDKLSLV